MIGFLIGKDMQKNQELISIVSSMGSNGEGVIKDEGKIVFVPFAIAGEKVRYKVLKVSNKIAYGKLLEVLTPAEERVRPKCPLFGKCGGCQLQHIKYVNQLKIKEDNVKSAFNKIANLNVDVKSSIKGNSEWGYRNKLQLPVGQINGQTVIGFYAENSHRIIPIKDCPINASWTKNVITSFKNYIEENDVKGYDELTHTGELREITVKEVKGNLIITVVTLSDNLKNKDSLINTLKTCLKYNFSLYHNVNDKRTNVIYGDDFKLLYGAPDYTSEMLGIKYKIGVRSFMQVNTSVCSKLYSAVKEACSINENTTVIDAYSGAGLMTALLSKDAKKGVGVEIIPEAVDCANDLARLNGLQEKISNYVGKCEDIIPDIIAKEKKENADICLVLDPPRKGCDKRVIESIINSNIDRIVYVSCMPSTLARDIGLIVGTLKFTDNGIENVQDATHRYKVESVRTFDMFSHTKHVETLVCLTKF